MDTAYRAQWGSVSSVQQDLHGLLRGHADWCIARGAVHTIHGLIEIYSPTCYLHEPACVCVFPHHPINKL